MDKGLGDRDDQTLRRVAGVTAAAAGAGLIAILLHSLTTTDADGPVHVPLFYFSSLANLFLCLESMRIARRGAVAARVRRFGHCLTTAWLMALGAALYRQEASPGGDDAALFLAHAVVPALVTALWITMPADPGVRWRDPLRWLAFPALYTAMILLRGAAVHTYPYEMLDVGLIGAGAVSANVARAFVVLLLLGADIVLIEKVRALPPGPWFAAPVASPHSQAGER